MESYDEDKNKEAMRLQLDLVDEVRAAGEQRLACYQNLMAKHYNDKVRSRDFQVGDLVLRKVMGAARDPSQGKLGPNWKDPTGSHHGKGRASTTSDNGRTKAAAPLEHGASSEILPVERI